MTQPEEEKPLPPMRPAPPLPEGYVAPKPWTQEQIAAWNLEHNAIQPGEADAFEARMKEDRARLKALRGKGAARMTPAEKDEALDLMLRGAR